MFQLEKALLFLIVALSSPTYAMEESPLGRLKAYLGFYELDESYKNSKECLSGELDLYDMRPSYALRFSGNPLVIFVAPEDQSGQESADCVNSENTTFIDDTIEYQSTAVCKTAPKKIQTTTVVVFEKNGLKYTQESVVSGRSKQKWRCRLIKKSTPPPNHHGLPEPEPNQPE